MVPILSECRESKVKYPGPWGEGPQIRAWHGIDNLFQESDNILGQPIGAVH